MYYGLLQLHVYVYIPYSSSNFKFKCKILVLLNILPIIPFCSILLLHWPNRATHRCMPSPLCPGAHTWRRWVPYPREGSTPPPPARTVGTCPRTGSVWFVTRWCDMIKKHLVACSLGTSHDQKHIGTYLYSSPGRCRVKCHIW